MSRKITLNITGESKKQYSILVLELNNMAKAWKKFGPDIDIKADKFDKIIRWGKKKHGDQDEE